MPEEISVSAGKEVQIPQSTVVVRVEGADRRSLPRRIVNSLLSISILLNFWLLLAFSTVSGISTDSLPEEFVDGTEGASSRIAVIRVSGMISPPFTERWIARIQQAAEDETVRGVVLEIDSPGGFVADSHQLYHEIRKLAETKTVFVSMKRLAASGGYYIAVAAGTNSRIFAEPTSWTGSIGVIIARYNAAELAEKIGVKVEPLVTGPLKDTLNPFRDMTEQESAVWDAILADSFDRFVGVIDEGRSNLDEAAVRELATGQIYTATQALENGLVDEIGYLEDVLQALASQLQLTEWEAFEYPVAVGLLDSLVGVRSEPPSLAEQFLQSTVPAPMYFASWNPLALHRRH